MPHEVKADSKTYTPTISTVTVTASAQQFSSVPGTLVQVRARPDNTANVSIGNSGVTLLAGYLLDPGGSTPWVPIANLSSLYYIGANTTDKIDYIVLT